MLFSFFQQFMGVDIKNRFYFYNSNFYYSSLQGETACLAAAGTKQSHCDLQWQ